ncbi:MAG: gliding motility-associated C-terminal domain-containing protein [Flavobacteriales bacterium]|nr:gliding motility-associated C-terminal domain-containing protein [Flavobacteriales bacterium]
MFRPFSILVLLGCAVPILAHDHHRANAAVQFHLNKGQWPEPVLYRAKTPGGAVFVERGAFTHVLRSGGPMATHGRTDAVPVPLRMHAYRMHFEGAGTVGHRGMDVLPHFTNYFLGNDRSKWAPAVPVYGGVELEGVYPGIGLHIDGTNGVKYDWIVAPGADPAQIVIRFEGHDKLRAEHGVLNISTTAGDVVEQRPVAWQLVHGRKELLEVAYALDGDRVSYVFPEGFDRRYAVIIDPVVTFCSFIGSSADNFGTTATYDELGHLYGAGTVFDIGYPTTLGVLQDAFGGPLFTGTDMAITKFTPDGTELVWSTYLGGSGSEVPHSMVTNEAGELYVLGTTESTDFPISTGCYDNSFDGGEVQPFSGSYGFSYLNGTDAVVIHLNTEATDLIGATYIGGSGNDGLNQHYPLLRNYGDPFRGEIIMDHLERPIVATSTSSSDLLTTPGATQPVFGGSLDAYVFRMDPTLSTMLWATYYGGTQNDNGLGVQVASTGEVYLTGGTQSADLIMAGQPFSPSLSGDADGYIARFSSTGDQLLGATYLGTQAFDQSYFVQLDTADDVYVVGQTAGNYPVTPGHYANPLATQFIHKFTTDLSAEEWSTRIGADGHENISPSAFLVSICGQIYFSGWGGGTNPVGGGLSESSTAQLEATEGAFQESTDGSDFYLMVLNADALTLAYATFFGGTSGEHVDGGTSRFDKDGIVYQAVCAGCSGTFPTTPGAWSSTDMGQNCNLGVIKMNFEQGVQAFIDVDALGAVACLDRPFTFEATGNAVTYTWDFGDGAPQETGTTVTHVYDEVGDHEVMLIGTDNASCNLNDTARVTVTVAARSELLSQFGTVLQGDCNGYSVELTNMSSGSTDFIWNFGDNTTGTTSDPVHPYATADTYEITLGVIDPACPDTVFSSSTVTFEPAVLTYQPTTPLALCNGESVMADAGAGYDSYLWSTGSDQQQIPVTVPGDYGITVTEGVCEGQGTVVVESAPMHAPIPDVLTCTEASVMLSPSFTAQQVLWSNGAQTPSITVTQQGSYWFDAIDGFGCSVTDTVTVIIAPGGEGAAVVPNVFTPNGDGMNDTFQVTGLAIDRFSMEIYDRWGKKMYETSSLAKGWNGGLDNATGSPVPDGTYYYIVDLQDRCSDKPTTNFTGHVTLLR